MEGSFYSRNEPAIQRVSDLQPVKCRSCDWGSWTGVNQLCIMPRCWKKDDELEKVKE